MQRDPETSFILNLIENVARKKCLYDKKDPFYFHKRLKEKAWTEVGENCGKSGADCKHRWKLLRERFGKELKRLEAPSSTGMELLENWKFLEPMMFLKEYLAPRRNRNNVDEQGPEMIPEQSYLSGDSLLEPLSPNPRKKIKPDLDGLCKKFGQTIKTIELSLAAPIKQENTDEIFMKAVVSLMKDLPPDEKDEFQAGIMQELFRLRRNCRHLNQ